MTSRNIKMARLMVDCDTGVDDALALTIALQWPGVTVEAITCTSGNSSLENVLRNTVSVLKANKCRVPVFPGCRSTLLRRKHSLYNRGAELVHASNGFGGVEIDLTAEDFENVQNEHAAVALTRLAKEKGNLTLVTLAPLTNIAMAMRLDPNFTSNLKEIVIMGGNFKGKGTELGGAEFNFFMDAEAANIVVSEALCPITLVPFDACERSSRIPWDWFTDLIKSPGSIPEHGRLMGEIMRHHMANFEPAWPFFNPCDGLAMIAALDKSSIVEKFETRNKLTVNIDEFEPVSGVNGYGCLDYESEQTSTNSMENRLCSIVSLMDCNVIKTTLARSLCYSKL